MNKTRKYLHRRIRKFDNYIWSFLGKRQIKIQSISEYHNMELTKIMKIPKRLVMTERDNFFYRKFEIYNSK